MCSNINEIHFSIIIAIVVFLYIDRSLQDIIETHSESFTILPTYMWDCTFRQHKTFFLSDHSLLLFLLLRSCCCSPLNHKFPFGSIPLKHYRIRNSLINHIFELSWVEWVRGRILLLLFHTHKRSKHTHTQRRVNGKKDI